MDFRPCIIKNKATGQSVHVTIFDREMYFTGFWTFDDLVEIYGEDNDLPRLVGAVICANEKQLPTIIGVGAN